MTGGWGERVIQSCVDVTNTVVIATCVCVHTHTPSEMSARPAATSLNSHMRPHFQFSGAHFTTTSHVTVT